MCWSRPSPHYHTNKYKRRLNLSPKFSVDSDAGYSFAENALIKLKLTCSREKMDSDPSRENGKPNFINTKFNSDEEYFQSATRS